MAIPKINKQDILKALQYIDENGVPFHNQSTKYELVSEDGKRYPPKYVIAVADHIANGVDVSTESYNMSHTTGSGLLSRIKRMQSVTPISVNTLRCKDCVF